MNDKEVGHYGEVTACQYLIQRGFVVVDKNFKKKWGELDIIARNDDTVHFIEVKTVSYETKARLVAEYTAGEYRPESRVDRKKKQKIQLLVQAWLQENAPVKQYQIDIMAVYMVPQDKFAAVDWFPNVEI